MTSMFRWVGLRLTCTPRPSFCKKLLRALTTQLGLRLTDNDNASTFKQLFQYRSYQCTNSITGIGLKGIGRRPAWMHGSDTEKCIVLKLHHARTLYEQSKSKDPTRFGREFNSPVWKAPAITQVYTQLAATKKPTTTTLTHSVCHLGHPLNRKTYHQDLVPMWRGARLDVPLCQACHSTMTYEVNTPTLPFIAVSSTHPVIPALRLPRDLDFLGTPRP